MGKHFKLRFSKVIPLFQSCRSKDPSNLPENPVPVFFRLSPINPKAIDSNFPPLKSPPRHHHHQQQPSVKRRVSSAILSVGCGCRSKSDDSKETAPSEFRWKKDEKWHVVAKVNDEMTSNIPRRKIYNSSVSGDSEGDNLYSSSPRKMTIQKNTNKKAQIRNKKKKTRLRVNRFSTSSADSGWFSSEGGEENEEEEETETLVSSSRTFSTDSSSEFDTHLETIRESPIHGLTLVKKKKKKKKVRSSRVKRYASKRKGESTIVDDDGSPETESPARLSVFQRLMPSCKVEGKVKESFAVVKKSEDPYEDFRRSMLEMIMEKQMFEARDLEQLLHCFLSLNSKRHHQIIVEAFSEIWEFLFCTSSSTMHGDQK